MGECLNAMKARKPPTPCPPKLAEGQAGVTMRHLIFDLGRGESAVAERRQFPTAY
ncbi:MAG: hypothetical protein L0Y56_12315 [Nitrospira sp.]|nr:hypothetical protein [Nitrospira sp.]